ncbi:NUDIX hydrolase [Maricaulis maris]|uniref:NUDIX hydrolase n=1 Tax=Maricaulis maris TaxID=74318 RepID=UPI003BAB4AF9
MPASPNELKRHVQPALAVDLALLTIVDGVIEVLVQKRLDGDKVGGTHALPGSIVRIDETLEQTVNRVLQSKAGLHEAFVEQLRTFSALDRDPRGRVVSVAYFALVPPETFKKAARKQHGLDTAVVQHLGTNEEGPAAQLRDRNDQPMQLAFDHSLIVATTLQRLRGKLDYTGVGFELLPHRFTLRELQEIHETILGHTLTKPAFRKKMIDRGFVRPTGKREKGKAFRPAELYERTNKESES